MKRTSIETYKVIEYDQERVLARVIHFDSGKMYDMIVKIPGFNKKTRSFVEDFFKRKGFEIISIKPILKKNNHDKYKSIRI